MEGAWGQEQGWGLKGEKEEVEPEGVILAGRALFDLSSKETLGLGFYSTPVC